MFTTVEQVKELTNYDVDAGLILRAQAVIEVFIGKVEAEVSVPNDQAILARATAFQAAYMQNNADHIYEQVAITYAAQTDSVVTLDASKWAPYIAPMALMGLSKLSWTRSRSVRFGSLYGNCVASENWETC